MSVESAIGQKKGQKGAKPAGWREGQFLIIKIMDAHPRNVTKCKWEESVGLSAFPS